MSLKYSTRYFKYELPPEVFTRQLELNLQLYGTASQDAWLHFVQFTGNQIDIDRFRYRDFRGQPVTATLHEGTVHAFLTVSPFNPDNRVNDQLVRYTLSIRTLVSQEPAIAADPSDLTLSIESLDPADHTDLMRAVLRGDALAVNRIFIESANSIPPMEMLLSFHLAAAAGFEDLVALFTLTDIDIQAQDANGQTALSLAEEAGHDRVAALLRAVTAEEDRRAPQRMAQEEIRNFLLYARDGDPDTKARTLTEAAKSGFTNLLHLLLTSRNLDLNIDLIDVYGETALMAALRAGHTDTVARLLALGADTDPQQESGRFTALIYASILGDQEVTEQLLAAGADVNYRGGNGWNALGWAVVEGNVNVVEQLIAAGADVNVKSEDYNLEQTALMLASQEYSDTKPKPQPRIVSLLLAAGADPNAQDSGGRSALWLATQDGYTEIVRLLLSAGADATLADDNGNTPLDIARIWGHHTIISLLQQAAR